MRNRYGKRADAEESSRQSLNCYNWTCKAYLSLLRNRAQNQQQLWRKGVDAIIEEYKRKWTERENKRTRYNYNPAAASQGGGRQRAPAREVQDARQDDDNNKDNEISHNILDACNHTFRMNKR